MDDGSSNINNEDSIDVMFNATIKFYVTSYPLYDTR